MTCQEESNEIPLTSKQNQQDTNTALQTLHDRIY